MKSIISTTYDNTYLFFLPIVTWVWNKLGVEVICFLSSAGEITNKEHDKMILIDKAMIASNAIFDNYMFFAPKHKESTYAQCARLYGGCLNLPEDEVLITSDVDILPFGEYLKQNDGNVQLFGADLLDGERMYPMCYCSATVRQWRTLMNINGETYQQKLDSELGAIEADHFRGNYWCKDQELLFNAVSTSILPITKHNRAKMPERFATNRIDRDDVYFMDRLNPSIVDYHMHRPGYTDDNFFKIMSVIKYFYPNDDLSWLKDYQTEYKKLL